MVDDKKPSNDTPAETPEEKGPPPTRETTPLEPTDIETPDTRAEPPTSAADTPVAPPGTTAAGADKADDITSIDETDTTEPASPRRDRGDAAAASPPPTHIEGSDDMARSTRTPSMGSMLTAGLAGGAVVAIAAGLAWSTMQPGDSGSNDKLTARLAALELKVDEIAARPAAGGAAPQAVSQLGARLDKLEKALAERPASAAGGPDPALMNRLSSAEAAVKSLGDTVSATDKRLDEALSAAEAARTQAEAAAKAADAAAPAAPGVQPAEIAALSSQIATAERTLSSLQQQVAQRSTAPISDRAVRLAVLADGLRAQVERGAPYASELAAAKQLVSDPQTFAPLEPFATTGVPSATALGRELSAVVPAMMQAADVPPGEGYLERLQAKAESLVRVRKVDQVKDAGAGADVAVVIGNAEAKARQGDLAGALESLGTLPPAVRAPAEPWIRKAEARRAAVAAARRVATAALGALANP